MWILFLELQENNLKLSFTVIIKKNRWQVLQYIFKGLLAIRNIMQSSNSVGQIIIEIIYVEETMSSRHSHVHLSYFSF